MPFDLLIIPFSEYDFFTFNTIQGDGNISVTTFVAPTLNANGDDRPVALAVQVDSLAPQTTYFIPPAVPGSLPDAWDGLDGFAVSVTLSTCSQLFLMKGRQIILCRFPITSLRHLVHTP